MTSNNVKVHPRMKELYKFFKYNGKVMDIIDYDPEIMHIFSRDVLKKIINDEDGWEEMLPKGIAKTIKDKNLFTRKLVKAEKA
ncbi:MAG: TonB-dependent receptor, partial [Pricia sp.]